MTNTERITHLIQNGDVDLAKKDIWILLEAMQAHVLDKEVVSSNCFQKS